MLATDFVDFYVLDFCRFTTMFPRIDEANPGQTMVFVFISPHRQAASFMYRPSFLVWIIQRFYYGTDHPDRIAAKQAAQ